MKKLKRAIKRWEEDNEELNLYDNKVSKELNAAKESEKESMCLLFTSWVVFDKYKVAFNNERINNIKNDMKTSSLSNEEKRNDEMMK